MVKLGEYELPPRFRSYSYGGMMAEVKTYTAEALVILAREMSFHVGSYSKAELLKLCLRELDRRA